MVKPTSEKLAELLKQEAQLKARIQLLKNRESVAERKRDTRRKILIGSAILARVKRGAWHEKQLMDMLDVELVEDRDRSLFELPLKTPGLTAAPAAPPPSGTPDPGPSAVPATRA